MTIAITTATASAVSIRGHDERPMQREQRMIFKVLTHARALRGKWAVLAVLATLALPAAGQSQTLRIAMTAADNPTTGGIPDNGSEGYRFTGYPIYDSLVNWDLSNPDVASGLVPGLATEWGVDPQNNRKWIFTLRKGVTFHDGSTFDADAVIWNLDRIFNTKAANYDSFLSAVVRSAIPMLDRYEKIDDDHVSIYTKMPFSPFDYLVSRILFASPAQYEKVGRNWQAFGLRPSGTGPFKVSKVTPRVSVELERNSAYWDKTRVPRLARLILFPMPEATTRLAALRSGQVDWIEAPPPDAIPPLKSAGFQISQKIYPHQWPWRLNDNPGSPFHDKRVRLALNYAIDRQAIVTLVNGTALPAAGFYDPSHPSFGRPSEHLTYDPEKAKALLREAGFGPGKPVKARVMISPSGSGQMMPLAMNEIIQANLKEIGFDIAFEVVDWGSVIVAGRNPADAPASRGVDAINASLPSSDPTYMYRFFTSEAVPPGGSNWSGYKNDKVDDLLRRAFETFDAKQRDALIGEAHALIVDDGAWAFIVHDLNPRALSRKVKGFVPVQSWFQDFTKVTVE